MSNLQYTSLSSKSSDEDLLAQLALDVSWTWNRAGGALWRQLNPELWDHFRVTLDEIARARSTAFVARTDRKGALGGEVLASQERLAGDWKGVSFGALRVDYENGVMRFEVPSHGS